MGALHVENGRYVLRYWNETRDKRKKERTKFPANANGRRDAEKLLQMREQEIERRRHGLVDRSIEFAKQPVEAHLKLFEQHLESRRATEKYRGQLLTRLRRMLRGMGVSRVTEITATATEGMLVELMNDGVPDRCLSPEQLNDEDPHARERRGKKLGAKSRDDYLDSLRHFCRWLHSTERLPKNPIVSIGHLCSKSRHEATATFIRRALTIEEFDRVVDAALRRGTENRLKLFPGTRPEVLHGLKLRGQARALAYTLAATIGIRVNALCALQWSDLDLEACTVRLRAAYAKNRRETRSDVPGWLAEQFLGWRQRLALAQAKVPQPTDRVFSLLPTPHKLKRLLDLDMEFAGVPRETTEGRVDFHALRALAATQLFEAGVDSKTAAGILGATEQVVSERYTKLRQGRGREAVNRLAPPKTLPFSMSGT